MPPIMRTDYCPHCGRKLIPRHLEGEGEVPYCENCQDFRFPIFSCAVSMVVTNEKRDKILLIKQYGRDFYVLVAGYINKGEDAEDAVRREVKEEVGLDAEEVSFNHSHYFPYSNTLMLNFTAVVKDEHVKANSEVDSWRWFTPEEARENIRKPSLAESFLLGYLDKEYHFE